MSALRTGLSEEDGYRDLVHTPRVDCLGGSYYAFCRLSCGWSGPWRRWAWRARRDARRHVAAVSAR